MEPSTSDFVDPSFKSDASEGQILPPFESVSCWSSSSDPLPDFTFMHLYCYLIESKDKNFDTESLKAFKSLKAYKYFADGFVQNVRIVLMEQIICTLRVYATLRKRLNHILCMSVSTKSLDKFIQLNVLVLLGK